MNPAWQSRLPARRCNGVTPFRLVGSRDEVREHVRQTLRVMAPGGGFIAGPGCALPAHTKEENIHELMDCVRREGFGAQSEPVLANN
jgi:uroporphyrinogen-III decarboxylase